MVAGKNYLKADPSTAAICFCFFGRGGREDWILGGLGCSEGDGKGRRNKYSIFWGGLNTGVIKAIE